MYNEQSELDNLIMAAKNTGSGLGINVEQEFKKCRRTLSPKWLDDKNFNQADLDFLKFYRKGSKSVLDTLIFRIHSAIQQQQLPFKMSGVRTCYVCSDNFIVNNKQIQCKLCQKLFYNVL